ncbi:AzlC family ABC transporter permease [Pseudonocardia humida]|uniref:AzlC family ABC transporter permease n=1 Tax=Pseudonocardia humida TaxID=2800819 RepID=A0ABT0ZZX1_9PSEU|nr:AzlC family ABC transporter permease [Pseudonocardia humida]MCO1656210.1 AzlC family ABC transporter permease [Pseudonocardia humida]
MARSAGWRRGLRDSAPLVLPTVAVGVTFGLLAAPVIGATAAVVMSAVVWSGTAQFAAVGVLGAGGGAVLAGASGLLANTRFVPMGFAIAASLSGPAPRRAAVGATVVDASFAIAHRGGGRFDAAALVGAMPLQYVAWLLGTAAGALGADVLGDPQRWGLDVLFPAFYLSLLIGELREDRRARLVAGCAAVIALALVPFTPAGVPVVAAAAAALIGLRERR